MRQLCAGERSLVGDKGVRVRDATGIGGRREVSEKNYV